MQANSEREGEKNRASAQKAEGKRHQDPVVAKLVFANQMTRVEFRLKNVKHRKECEECHRQPKRQARGYPWNCSVIHHLPSQYPLSDDPCIGVCDCRAPNCPALAQL